MNNPELLDLARQVLDKCRQSGIQIATAESCTGGLIGAYLTAISGSSDVMNRGFITYTNEAKVDMLGVKNETLVQYGAVSEAVVRQMAEGGLNNAPVQICVAVSGVAGPGGGSDEKPVGLVHHACAVEGQETLHARLIHPGNRDQVREAAVKTVFEMILSV